MTSIQKSKTAGLAKMLLNLLIEQGGFDTLELSEERQINHQQLVGAVKSLESQSNLIKCKQKSNERLTLTQEGEKITENGSHEAIVFNNIPIEGILLKDLMARPEITKIGFDKAMALGWISINEFSVTRRIEEINDITRQLCIRIQNSEKIPENDKINLKKRKLANEIKITSYYVTRGENNLLEKLETDLTQEMISGSWKTKRFKAYNFNALGTKPNGGHLHPLLKVRTQFRQIFLEMGFTEMPTNNYVESSFWNFDALFQPQQHPARDAHDTFFISDPRETTDLPTDYVEKVKTIHSVGGHGSQGYKYDWQLKEAAKNIMRTHTTSVSARALYKLSREKFMPAKYFSIDRVFRNETLDATHLAEFHQIEGLVADYNLSLGHLMGYIEQFFKKCGMKDVRFKPAYNPYTEPSMEIFGHHPGLKKWIEIGNSGVFRPEMLLPMGFPEKVSVIAWGLSLERPTMIKYGISNIRELFGPKVNLKTIYDNPICRLDE